MWIETSDYSKLGIDTTSEIVGLWKTDLQELDIYQGIYVPGYCNCFGYIIS